jgi:hypothetical protein
VVEGGLSRGSIVLLAIVHRCSKGTSEEGESSDERELHFGDCGGGWGVLVV